MSNKILAVVGSANVDLVFESPRFPVPGETVLGTSFATYSGGKGANQAVAAARLGASVEFVGKVGDDEYGARLRKSLQSDGVSLTHLTMAKTTPTGTAGIVVATSGENTIIVNPGANADLNKDEVKGALRRIEPAHVLTQFEISEACVGACVGKWRLQVNPAPARPLSPKLARQSEMITPNRTEAQALTGIWPSDQGQCALCARRILEMGFKIVVITLGDEGSFVGTPSMFHHIPTVSVKSIDSTGAGDTFNGALAAFLLEGRDLLNAVVLANAAAAISTTRRGAQASMPTREEVRSLMPTQF